MERRAAPRGHAADHPVDHPEVMITVRCDLHPWMQGWLGVVDHPYFGVSGADGRVTLRNVPPGDYVVGVWHERFGTREARVSAGAEGHDADATRHAGSLASVITVRN